MENPSDLEKEVEKLNSDFQMFQKILQDALENLGDRISELEKEYGRTK